MKNWLPQLWFELSVPQKWLLSVGLVLLALFLVVVPPFQKPDEQVHFFRTIGVARGTFACNKNQQGVFQNYIPDYLAKLPDDAYVSHLAFNDEVKFSWKVFLTNAARPVSPSEGSSLVNSPKACSLPFLMYLPMAVVLAVPVWLQADPVLIFFLGRLAQTLVGLGLWLGAVYLTPKKLRLLPLFLLVIPMVPHQLTSYSKDALHLSAGMIAMALWLRLLEVRLRSSSKLSFTKLKQWYQHQLHLLVGLVVAVAVVVLSRPQYGFWLMLPLTVLPGPVHGKLARKVKQYAPAAVTVLLGIAVVLGLIGWSLRSEMYSTNSHTVGVLTESMTGIYPAVQVQYLLTYPEQIVTIANTTIETYGMFYLVSMIGQLGWLDNMMYWFVIGGVVGGLVAVTVKIRDSLPKLRWWQAGLVVAVILGTLAGVFGSLYLYGSPVASQVVEAVQGRYFLLLIPLVMVLIGQVNRQQFRWLVPAILGGLLVSVVVATLVRYYAFDDYYYLQAVPQTVLKTIEEDERFQSRLQVEVGKKLRGVVLTDASSSTSAQLVTVPYQLKVKDANCQDELREVVIDNHQWQVQKGRVEVLFPALLMVKSSVCIEVLPYKIVVEPQSQLRLISAPQAEVLYIH